ncbi:MAG: hypothetical protein UR78_C0028G0005 [Candidatus Moranbacteria bacterium GW2011_GWF2_35_39]|nr:MAG: hypothetical protein UR78_C0028G0005 [Candidatus Moranbacteria bacterium GW2011_GWF2_35_39]
MHRKLLPLNIQLFAEKTPDVIVQELQIKHQEELKKVQDELNIAKDTNSKLTDKVKKLEEVNTSYYNKLIVQETKQEKTKDKVEPEDDFLSAEELVQEMLGQKVGK